MSNFSLKALSAVLFLSLFVVWGCASTDTKQPVEANKGAVAGEADVVESGKADESVPEKQEKQPATAPVAGEQPAAPAVETMPAKDVSTPIAVESMPEPVRDQVGAGASQKAASASPEASGPVAKAASSGPLKPGHHVVTLAKKDPSHPQYGKGHPIGFVVDGVPGKSLVLERGKTYTFEVHTDPKHDVYFSRKEIGWGSTPLVEGVEGAFIYDGIITFKPDEKTPDKVYYACRNHPYMGATLYIVNPGETVDIEKERAKVAPAAVSAPKAGQVSEAKVKQKLMFADMMMNGKGAKRVMASDNAEAKALLAKAKTDLAASREKLLAGALAEALALADSAVKGVSAASRLVPSEDAKAQLARRYDELRNEVRDFEASYQSNYDRLAKAGAAPKEAEYDKAFVERLKSEAGALAEKGDYAKANARLEQAQAIVTKAIHGMLDSKTLVYDLKFDTPADEYEYELKRFTGYEELIPVAIEMKKPAQGALSLMDSFLKKARKRRDEAKAKAEAGDYATAIAMMQEATKTVRRALRMVGVSQ